MKQYDKVMYLGNLCIIAKDTPEDIIVEMSAYGWSRDSCIPKDYVSSLSNRYNFAKKEDLKIQYEIY